MVASLKRWVGKVAVVTGASSGIGAAIAEQLVEAGVIVVGLARRKELMEELSKKLHHHCPLRRGKFYAIKTDIRNEEEVMQAFKWIKKNLGPVHILVNNAGLAQATTLIDGDTEKWEQVLDTNVLGLCIATREAVKDMRANKVDGHIIHINSTDGHKVPNFPGLNVYPASKFAVTGLTETLRLELNSIQSSIKITSVSPGAVATNFLHAAGLDATEAMQELIKTLPMLKAEDVADAVLYVLGTPPHVQIHELMIKPIGEMF